MDMPSPDKGSLLLLSRMPICLVLVAGTRRYFLVRFRNPLAPGSDIQIPDTCQLGNLTNIYLCSVIIVVKDSNQLVVLVVLVVVHFALFPENRSNADRSRGSRGI